MLITPTEGISEHDSPQWSVMIPTFNSEKYIRQTLESVLQNVPSSGLQFWVVDNGSTDSTEAIVQEAGSGKIHFLKNDRNYGVMGNFNRCVALARGRYVHILNSDDLVKAGFYTEYEKIFEAQPEVYLISSNSELIDDAGNTTGHTATLEHLKQPSNNVTDFLYQNPVRTPSVAVRRAAYKTVGDFNTKLIQCGDWDMWVRVIHSFKGLHLDKVLTRYREHGDNESSKVYQSGENILDTERLYRLFIERGYPVSRKKCFGLLSEMAYNQYLNFHLRRNPNAAKLKDIFVRMDAAYRAELSSNERTLHSLNNAAFRALKTAKSRLTSRK